MKNLLFGAGNVSKQYLLQLTLLKVRIDSVVVSNKQGNPNILLGLNVESIEKYIDERDNVTVIIGVSEQYKNEVKTYLKQKGFKDIWEPALLPMQYKYFLTASKKEFLEAWYLWKTGEKLDIDKPVTYNEKIQRFKLYGVDRLVEKLADKITVRDWIKDKIGESYLTKIYGIWESFDDIDFSLLPDKFVLKCNHGSGFNYIVRNKAELDISDAKRSIEKWLCTDFSDQVGLELQYKAIVPKIYAEEYLENYNSDLYDYKFWCFSGRVEFIMFLSERQNGLKMNNFTTDWKPLLFTYDYENRDWGEIRKPKKLKEMLHIAEALSEGFPHVRVDLYQLENGEIKFGEMTFTSKSGICKWSDESINRRLGKLIK